MWTRIGLVAMTTIIFAWVLGSIMRLMSALRIDPNGWSAVALAVALVVFVGGGIAGILGWSAGLDRATHKPADQIASTGSTEPEAEVGHLAGRIDAA